MCRGAIAIATAVHLHLLVLTGEQGVLLEEEHQPSSEPDPDLDPQISDMSSGAWDEGDAACPPKGSERDLLGDLESSREEGGGKESVDRGEVPPRTISVTSGKLAALDASELATVSWLNG